MQLIEAAIAEAPVLRNTYLLALINRKEGSAVKEDDFRIYKPLVSAQSDANNGISPSTAAAMLSLANEGLCPPYMLGAWQEVQRIAEKSPARCPDVRALVSDCGNVAVIAPTFANGNIRGGLVGTGAHISGEILLRDIDRKLLTYKVKIPERQSAGWIQASTLLIMAP